MRQRLLGIGFAAFGRPFEDPPEEVIGDVILHLPVHRAHLPRDFGIGRHQLALALGDHAVAARHHPIGGALENDDFGGILREFGDHLHRARRRSDDADPLAGPVEIGVPVGTVHLWPVEAALAFDLRPARPVELAERGDQYVAFVAFSAFGRDRPRLAVLAPDRFRRAVAEVYVVLQAVLLDQEAGVVEEFGLLRIEPRPVRRHRETELVKRHLHVAGASRIAVLVPGAADRGFAFDDDGVMPLALQPHRRAEPAEPRPHDDCALSGHMSSPKNSPSFHCGFSERLAPARARL